jgi:hypothetical protein
MHDICGYAWGRVTISLNILEFARRNWGKAQKILGHNVGSPSANGIFPVQSSSAGQTSIWHSHHRNVPQLLCGVVLGSFFTNMQSSLIQKDINNYTPFWQYKVSWPEVVITFDLLQYKAVISMVSSLISESSHSETLLFTVCCVFMEGFFNCLTPEMQSLNAVHEIERKI